MDADRIAGILADISDALSRWVASDAPRGLLNGRCGAALFHAYHYHWTGHDRELERMTGVLKDCVAAIADAPSSHAHCGGLAGIAWCLQHLIDRGFVERAESDEIFGDVDAVLAGAMDSALADGRHDFLHEGLGIALYFLEKPLDPPTRRHLERVAARLAASAARDHDAVRWQDRMTRRGTAAEGGPVYNLGLAHGTPAIIVVLAKLHARGIAMATVEPILRGATDWLRSTRLPPKPDVRDVVSLYPLMVDAGGAPVGPSQTRLGWCYGDLGIAIALAHAGRQLEDRASIDEASAILTHSLAHRDVENGAIEDASLCHGSMGLSHIYRRAWWATGNDSFRDGADRWLTHTVALRGACDAAAGFRSKRADAFVECFDVLQGIAGIGLGLLAAVDRDTDPGWDRCMLLS